MDVIIGLCTVPDGETAKKLSLLWLEAGWAACVNEIPAVTSRYIWKEKLETDSEHLLIVKTTAEGAKNIETNLKEGESHPYDCPEWVVLEGQASQTYGQWVHNQVSS